MKLLKITANLRTGFHSSFDWSLSIDGIIAYQSQLKKLGIEQFTITAADQQSLVAVDDLPIEKEFYNYLWWYQCSRPFFTAIETHTKNIHRRFNAQEAERYVTKIGKIETTKGAYKNARISKNIYITNSVHWYVNGDAQAIKGLLSDVTHIGGFRSGGMGAVRSWDISEHNNLNDCRFKRALPVQFAVDNGVQGVELNWAIRPPSQLITNQFNCVIPKNE